MIDIAASAALAYLVGVPMMALVGGFVDKRHPDWCISSFAPVALILWPLFVSVLVVAIVPALAWALGRRLARVKSPSI